MLSFLTDTYRTWQGSEMVLKVTMAVLVVLMLALIVLVAALLISGVVRFIDTIGRPRIEAQATVVDKAYRRGTLYVTSAVASRTPDSFLVCFDVEGYGELSGDFDAGFWDVADAGCKARVELVTGRMTGTPYLLHAELA